MLTLSEFGEGVLALSLLFLPLLCELIHHIICCCNIVHILNYSMRTFVGILYSSLSSAVCS